MRRLITLLLVLILSMSFFGCDTNLDESLDGSIPKEDVGDSSTPNGDSDDNDGTDKPFMSVVGVPTTLSINEKTTLPKATVVGVEVKVSVSVTMNGKNVKEVSINDDGYAYIEAEKQYDYVVFDNAENMSFYPVEEGTYFVIYQAQDKFGKIATPHMYSMKCFNDSSSPKLKSINEAAIPRQCTLSSGEITFPYPVFVDNSGNENVSVSFTIKDITNNNIVVSFKDIYDTVNLGRAYSSTIYEGSYDVLSELPNIFDENGFKFNFNNYILSNGQSIHGKYEVTYKANDSRSNKTEKTYEITLAY